ncbi:MAG TPA: SUF system Fe-S cluster assembly protein [Chitinophagales bacterium]|nr:SUF system Fe-S cluster assembly protein [Chitinophagales bacterium]HMW12025.1 SUF system Fe-S cluster assembly protein [Chitinophagales bacterium]HMX59703.1 SUF system Fe-S cluster assembly protein [Chitinophagales bacterium]HMY24224.1 SUF system Fe-S cluster assembly protein [Chitinophagales bacterium]HMZ33110.1 SUF system Fe-S cluster assembly protein [Chitinophagales bacterium]
MESEQLTKTFMEIQDEVYTQLQTIYDPEIPVNIFELGLIYEVNVDIDNNVQVLMTLTAPNCPAAESLPAEVEQKVSAIEGVNSCKVDITFDPPWDQEMMSESAKLELGFL